MRIAVAYMEHGRDRGVERVSAEGALAAAAAGHEIHYYCARHAEAGHSNISFHHIRLLSSINSLRLLQFANLARKALARSACDVTHSYGTVIGCDVVSAQSCHRAGMEATLHRPEEIRERPNFGIADRIRLWFERENYGKKRYRFVIACSQRVKRELYEYYGVPDSDVVVIPNGVDIDTFQPERCRAYRGEMRQKLGIREDEFVCLFAGNEFARKGLQTAIEAVGRLADPSVRLLVVGGGNAHPYRHLAEHVGVLPQVIFAGHAQDMTPYYGAADLFVFPARYEAFGLVITEAMASGVPVLVSACAGSAEDLIRDGEDGVLISDPYDALEVTAKIRMIRDNWELRTMLSSFGRLRVMQTGWEHYGRRLLEVYNEVQARKRGQVIRR